MRSQPKIRAAWYLVDRDVAQVCRDRDGVTVPTVTVFGRGEVHTLADAHEAARGRRSYCLNDFFGSPGSQGLVPTQLRLKRHTTAHSVLVYLPATKRMCKLAMKVSLRSCTATFKAIDGLN